MHVPKTLIWQASGNPLSWRECLDAAVIQHRQELNDYSQLGVQLKDLSSEEILAAVKEKWQRLQGTWVDTEDDLRRHRQFWETFKSHPSFTEYHGWVHPECRAGTTWLRSRDNGFLL